jgi:hypothetical protein
MLKQQVHNWGTELAVVIVVEENGHQFYIDDKEKATLVDAISGA